MTWWMHLILAIVSTGNVFVLNYSAWGEKTFTPYLRGMNTGIWATCALINIVQLLS